MSYYEYRVVPAPNSAPRVKGVKGTANLFAHGLEDALNIEGRDAWEYQRSETLTVSANRGWLRKPVSETVTVLIYRRWVETIEAGKADRPATAFVPRDEPETPEMLAHEIAETPKPQSTDDQPASGADTAPRSGPSLSASRRPGGDLRPVPGAARD